MIVLYEEVVETDDSSMMVSGGPWQCSTRALTVVSDGEDFTDPGKNHTKKTLFTCSTYRKEGHLDNPSKYAFSMFLSLGIAIPRSNPCYGVYYNSSSDFYY